MGLYLAITKHLAEHVTEGFKAAQQFGFTFWGEHDVSAVGAGVNIDAFDVDLSPWKCIPMAFEI